jgi:hypothetical protein
MRALTFSIVAAVTLCGCTTASSPPSPAGVFSEATPLCNVIGSPKSYLGKRVLVRGYLAQTPEGGLFFDVGCKRGLLPIKLLPETPRTRRLMSLLGSYLAHSPKRPPQVPVVYSGTFTDNSPALFCAGLCIQFTLDGAEIVAVRPD